MSGPIYILMAILVCAFTLEAAERKDPLIHVVKTGNTLSGIAKQYRVSLAQIYRWNTLKNDRIRIGQRLKIWLPVRQGDWYIVRSGDNLSEIAARFSLPISRLKTLNQLKSDTIQLGQKLRLSSPGQSSNLSLIHI